AGLVGSWKKVFKLAGPAPNAPAARSLDSAFQPPPEQALEGPARVLRLDSALFGLALDLATGLGLHQRLGVDRLPPRGQPAADAQRYRHGLERALAAGGSVLDQPDLEPVIDLAADEVDGAAATHGKLRRDEFEVVVGADAAVEADRRVKP